MSEEVKMTDEEIDSVRGYAVNTSSPLCGRLRDAVDVLRARLGAAEEEAKTSHAALLEARSFINRALAECYDEHKDSALMTQIDSALAAHPEGEKP